MALVHSPKVATDGLVFYYDMSNIQKSWKGKPATNTCSFGTYDYGYNSTKISNATPPVPPPVTGYPIYKITSTDGNDAQQILYTATVDQVNGGTYTHSAYVYLESGTWVSAGQHWNPWDYGTPQYIPKGVWTRIEDPVTNSGSNYGNVALCYNTNGAVYVTGSQYEIGSFASPLVNGTRSNTQAIVDLISNNTFTASNLTYNSDNTFSFNGSTSLISLPSLNLQRNFTLECWVKLTSAGTSVGFFGQGPLATNQGLHIGWFPGRGLLFGMYSNDLECPSYSMTYNTWHHFVFTYNNSTYFRQTFADGVLVASGTLSPYTGSGQFNIGAIFSSATTPFVGDFAVAKCYSRVLSATEVQDNFNAFRGRYGL